MSAYVHDDGAVCFDVGAAEVEWSQDETGRTVITVTPAGAFPYRFVIERVTGLVLD